MVLYIIGAIWIAGWVLSVRQTSISQEPWGFFKIRGIVMLFFIWPYIAYCMANQGDI